MKFLKNNLLSLAVMTALFTVAMMGDADASVFTTAGAMLVSLFKNAKMIIFIIGGFGLIALAFQAIFGKVKWAWFAALAFGLAVVAAASSIITYAANNNNVMAASGSLADTLGNSQGMDGDTMGSESKY